MRSSKVFMVIIMILMIGFISVGVNNTEASLSDFFIFKWFKNIFNLNKDNSITGNSLKSISGFVTVTQTQCSTNNDCPSHSYCVCQSEGGPIAPPNKEGLPIAKLIEDITGKTTNNCHCVCENGWYDCDSKTINGCEKSSNDLKTDPNNCGSCGHKCASDETCINGVCEKYIYGKCKKIYDNNGIARECEPLPGSKCKDDCGFFICEPHYSGSILKYCEGKCSKVPEGGTCRNKDCDCQDGLYCSQGHCCPKGTSWDSTDGECKPSNRCSDEDGTEGWVFRSKDGQACCFYIGDKDTKGDNQERYDCTRLGLQKCLRSLDNLEKKYDGWDSNNRPFKNACVYTTGTDKCEGNSECGTLVKINLI